MPSKPHLAGRIDCVLSTSSVDVTPGTCEPVQGRSTVMCIKNTGPLFVTPEVGQVCAAGQAIPSGTVRVRRADDPETGEPADVLYSDESGELCIMSVERAYGAELEYAAEQAYESTVSCEHVSRAEESQFCQTLGYLMYQSTTGT